MFVSTSWSFVVLLNVLFLIFSVQMDQIQIALIYYTDCVCNNLSLKSNLSIKKVEIKK